MQLEERDVVRLRDMLLWSRKAIFILGQRSFDELLANEEKRLALVRCIEVIGEAGHDVSPAVKDALPHGLTGNREFFAMKSLAQ